MKKEKNSSEKLIGSTVVNNAKVDFKNVPFPLKMIMLMYAQSLEYAGGHMASKLVILREDKDRDMANGVHGYSIASQNLSCKNVEGIGKELSLMAQDFKDRFPNHTAIASALIFQSLTAVGSDVSNLDSAKREHSVYVIYVDTKTEYMLLYPLFFEKGKAMLGELLLAQKPEDELSIQITGYIKEFNSIVNLISMDEDNLRNTKVKLIESMFNQNNNTIN